MKIDKVYLFLGTIMLIAIGSWISSCKHDSIIPDNTPQICFEKDVLLIFTSNCTMGRCHSGLGEGLNLTGYTGIISGIVPGKPNSSSIYKAITARPGGNNMPPDAPLSEENRTIIRLWILQGAGNDPCPK
jgi:hypothetical protein